MMDKLFMKILDTYIVGENEKYPEKIQYELRTKNPKIIKLIKILANQLYHNTYLTYEDCLQQACIVIIEVANELIAKGELNEEYFTYLLTNDHEEGSEDLKKLLQIYSLLKLRCKSKFIHYTKQREREISEKACGDKIRVVNFNQLTHADVEMTVEEYIDNKTFDSNKLYLEEGIKEKYLQEWIEGRKDLLTKKQIEYLENPVASCRTSRARFQRMIEDKLRQQALKEFGTSDSNIVKLLMDKKIIESIVDAEDFKKEVVNNIDWIYENLEGFIDLDFNILKDINKACNSSSHEPRNASMIKVSNLLFDKLDKITEALNGFKVDKVKEKEVIKRARFNLSKIPNIKLDFETYPKTKEDGKTENPLFRKFRMMHKDCFEGKCSIDSKFYDWTKYHEWFTSNAKGSSTKYYIFFIEKENVFSKDNCILLPGNITQFLRPTKVYISKEGYYNAMVTEDGKQKLLKMSKKPDGLQELINDYKTKKLHEMIEENRSLLSYSAYNYLKEYKFVTE